MRVGVDGTIWGGRESGVATSTRRLFLALRDTGRLDLTAWVPERALPLLGDGAGARLRALPERRRGRRVAWQQLALPRRCADARIDVLYCPCYTVPLRWRGPRVVTVHDLIALKRPDLCRPLNVLHFRMLVAPSVRAATRITTPTEAVRRDLVERLDVPEDKIDVVPWGVDLELASPPREMAAQRVREWYDLDGPFVLFAGGIEPKKNLDALVEATRSLDTTLVVAGPPGWGARETRRGLELLGPGRFRHVGFVDPERLGALYAAATVFAFPSWIEGFGLPVVEAMARGTPVVASDAPALTEVCGGAALHVPPGDPAALAAALRRVLEDTELREDLVRRGRRRAERFTWTRAAGAFMECLRRAAE
jgi:glycosyltransferase involved in cell wall biosynthesis